MSDAVGGLLKADDSQFDNIERRLAPSCPQYPLGVETWPVGTPLFIKEIYSRYQVVAGQWNYTVEGIDAWYFDELKLQEIAKLQLAANISKKKKSQRRLLRNLATASLENQHELIQFNKVGRGVEYRYEEVAKQIADKVKELGDDEAQLPRHLTFHLSIESPSAGGGESILTGYTY